MSLSRAGFYRTAEEILRDIAEVPDPNEASVVSYLQSGEAIVILMQASRDLLDPDRRLMESAGIFTDGVWVWPRNLAHYVETYHVALPPEFSLHIRGRNWQMPELTEEEIHEAVEAFREDQEADFSKLRK